MVASDAPSGAAERAGQLRNPVDRTGAPCRVDAVDDQGAPSAAVPSSQYLVEVVLHGEFGASRAGRAGQRFCAEEDDVFPSLEQLVATPAARTLLPAPGSPISAKSPSARESRSATSGWIVTAPSGAGMVTSGAFASRAALVISRRRWTSFLNGGSMPAGWPPEARA